jgi:uncharacterized protein (UPF0276 family)
VGLRLPHLEQILEQRPEVPWFELLADNHLDNPHALPKLERLRADYPLTLHCVGMSLGGTDPLDQDYLARVKGLADHLDIALVSDHLCFTRHGGTDFHDLLPVPYTEEVLTHVGDRIRRAQDVMGRRLLIENASAYLSYRDSVIPEGEFLAALIEQTGCGLLVDVNNAYVNEVNLGSSVSAFFDALPAAQVLQAHLAGYDDRGDYLLDAHNSPVTHPVWEHFADFVERFHGVPTLIEWDNDLPPLSELLAEAAKARSLMEQIACVGVRAYSS